MPRPVYLVCSSDIIEDKATNLVSAVKLVERIEAGDGNPAERARDRHIAFNFFAVASWMPEDDDKGVELEHRFLIRMPDDTDFPIGEPKKFQFEGEPPPLRRFIARLRGFPSVTKSGICIFESHVKRIESEEESVQRYPFYFEVAEADADKKTSA